MKAERNDFASMRTHFIIILLLPLGLFAQPRKTIDFNFDWRFHLGDLKTAMNPEFEDSTWRSVQLPHDWSIEQNYTTIQTSGSTGFLPTGIGWYRKEFRVPVSEQGREAYLEFDGIYKNAEVYLNGKPLGGRPNGYLPQSFSISDCIQYGQKNTIAVRVDHQNFADSRWYTGSGIYRNVRLIFTEKTHVPFCGAWVETPSVSTKVAKLRFGVVVEANSSQTTCRVVVKDPKGSVVATSERKSASDTTFVQLKVKSPALWSIDNPTLYEANVEVYNKGEKVDEYPVTFGIRSIRFDANEGFLLNEEHMKLKGVCLHHDAGAVGAIFLRDVWYRRLTRLKEIGVNAIRMSHNPADPGLLRLCDEMGFVVINEAFDEWRRNKEKWLTSRFANDMPPNLKCGYAELYEKWAEKDVKDMVRYSRNHPCVIMWSMGNEIEWTYPYYWKMEKSNQGLGNQVLQEETQNGKEELKETAEEIMGWIKEVDLTRPVTTGGVLPRAGNLTGYFDVPDVMGYNYRATHYDEDHTKYPNRKIYGSENWGTYQEWKDVHDRDFVAGLFLWTGIAYLGESGPYPWKGLEISLLDFAGFYTPRGHFFKTLWNNEPSVYLGTKHAKEADWFCENGEWKKQNRAFWLDKWKFENISTEWNYDTGDSVFVEVFSNSEEVELFVNNQSFGRKKPSDFIDHIAKYLVPFENGEIRAVGLKGNKEECNYSLQTAKWVSGVELVADKKKMKANGYDVTHVEVKLVDSKGNLVVDKKMQVTLEVEGEGRNIGVDNGWERNVQPHKANQIVTHNGRALLLVQSTRTPGKIRVKARAGAFLSTPIEIVTDSL